MVKTCRLCFAQFTVIVKLVSKCVNATKPGETGVSVTSLPSFSLSLFLFSTYDFNVPMLHHSRTRYTFRPSANALKHCNNFHTYMLNYRQEIAVINGCLSTYHWLHACSFTPKMLHVNPLHFFHHLNETTNSRHLKQRRHYITSIQKNLPFYHWK